MQRTLAARPPATEGSPFRGPPGLWAIRSTYVLGNGGTRRASAPGTMPTLLQVDRVPYCESTALPAATCPRRVPPERRSSPLRRSEPSRRSSGYASLSRLRPDLILRPESCLRSPDGFRLSAPPGIPLLLPGTTLPPSNRLFAYGAIIPPRYYHLPYPTAIVRPSTVSRRSPEPSRDSSMA